MPVVKACNLTLIDFSGKPAYHGNPDAKVILSNAFGYYTDPAPISPTDATDLDSAYTVMASTARGMWASRPEVSEDGEIVELGPGEVLVMAPFMSTGVRVLLRCLASADSRRTPTRGGTGILPGISTGSGTTRWRVILARTPSTRRRCVFR